MISFKRRQALDCHSLPTDLINLLSRLKKISFILKKRYNSQAWRAGAVLSRLHEMIRPRRVQATLSKRNMTYSIFHVMKHNHLYYNERNVKETIEIILPYYRRKLGQRQVCRSI